MTPTGSPLFDIKEISLDVVQMYFRRVIPDSNFLQYVSATEARHAELEATILTVYYSLLGREVESQVVATTNYPADWWEAFKEHWLPSWWLLKHPIRRTTVSTTVRKMAMCPHLFDGRREEHVRFLQVGEPPKQSERRHASWYRGCQCLAYDPEIQR